MKQFYLSVAVLALLSGCASIIEGSSETIAVNTNPPAADCSFQRENDEKIGEIAHISQTPGQSTVKKTKKDITVRCRKAGYQEATFINKSGIEPWFFGNIVLGGLIGMGVDWYTGAYNQYEEQINLGLIPLSGTAMMSEQPTPAAALAPAQPLAASMLASPSAAYGDNAALPAVQPQPAAMAAQPASLPFAAQVQDPARPAPASLGKITIPSGNASQNTSGWGRGQ